MFPIAHQKQPCELSCGATCLAMILGQDVKELINELPFVLPYADEVIYGQLVKNNFLPVKIDGMMNANLEKESIYLISTFGIKGGPHMVVGKMGSNGSELTVFDPCENKEIIVNWLNMLTVDKIFDCSSGAAL